MVKEGCYIAQVLEDDLLVALSYISEGVIMLNRGEGMEAHTILERALALFQELNLSFMVSNSMIHLANASLAMNDIPGAQAYLEKALPIAEEVGEEWLIASILNNQGELARAQGNYARAQTYYEKSERLFRKLCDIEDHNRLVHSLGYIALYQGNLDEADRLFHQSLTVFREMGNRRGIAECLAGLARLVLERGNPAKAATLLAAATSMIHAGGADWWPADQVEYQKNRNAIQSAMSETEFQSAWNVGQEMTLEQTLAFEAGLAAE